MLCTPTLASARSMKILPDGALVDNQLYCYDFEGARALFLADIDCFELRLKWTYFKDISEKQKALLEQLSNLAKEEADLLERALEAHRNLLADHKKMTEAYLTANSRDVFGGGIYIVAGVTAASFAGGVLLAAFLMR